MLDKTNLDSVKSVAMSFLYLDVKVDKKIPFVVSHPYFTTTVAHAFDNERKPLMLDITRDDDLKKARDAVKRDIDKVDNCLQFLHMIRPPYLPAFFRHTVRYLSKEDFSYFLASMWTLVEFPNADPTVSTNEFVRYFQQSDKKILMDEGDYKRYLSLPDVLTVYRGVKPKGKVLALSWTLSKKKAEWFANRFQSDGTVYRAKISREHVLAYFNCRNEQEVVLDCCKLFDVKAAE